MDWAINAYAKISGVGAFVVEWLPVIGSLGSLLVIGGTILGRAATAGSSGDLASALHALHPTGAEIGEASLAVAVIKSHFNHLANASKLDDHAAVLDDHSTAIGTKTGPNP